MVFSIEYYTNSELFFFFQAEDSIRGFHVTGVQTCALPIRPRPHRLERIVYDIVNSTHRTVSRIESGAADYTADVLHESTFAAGGPLDVRFGQGRSSAPGNPRLVQTPQLGFRFLQFNTARGPFADARLRRAVNY